MIIPTVMSWSSPHTVERAHARKGKKKDLQTWGWSGGGRKVRASRQHCARFRRGGAVSRHRSLCLETEGSGGGDRKKLTMHRITARQWEQTPSRSSFRAEQAPRIRDPTATESSKTISWAVILPSSRPPAATVARTPSRRLDQEQERTRGHPSWQLARSEVPTLPPGSSDLSQFFSLRLPPSSARGVFGRRFSLSASAQRLSAVISGPRDPLVIFLEKYDSL